MGQISNQRPNYYQDQLISSLPDMGVTAFPEGEPFLFSTQSAPATAFAGSSEIPTGIKWIIPLFDEDGVLVDFKRNEESHARTAFADFNSIPPQSPFYYTNIRIRGHFDAYSDTHTISSWHYISHTHNELVADLVYTICPGNIIVKENKDQVLYSWDGSEDAYWDMMTRRWRDEENLFDKFIRMGLARIYISLDLPDLGEPLNTDRGQPITFKDEEGDPVYKPEERPPEGQPDMWNMTGIYGIKKDDDIYIRIGTSYQKLIGREFSGYDLNHMLGNKWNNFKSNHIYLIVDDSVNVTQETDKWIRVDFKVFEKSNK